MYKILPLILFSFAAVASPTTIVVDFKDTATRVDIAETEDQLNFDLKPNSIMFNRTKITTVVVESSDAERILEKLNDDDDIEHAEIQQLYRTSEIRTSGAEFEVPDDPYYTKQLWHFEMIDLPAAWKVSTGEGAVVAVLDTGVTGPKSKYPQVEDLKSTCFSPGYNFVNDNEDPYDGQSHGSHVASTIAESTNNAVGGVGIAFKACIMPVKVLSDSGSGSTSDIAEGIRWAVDHGAHVINMSLGGGGFSQVLADAVKYADDHNVLVFCAAGNSGRPKIEYPAGMEGCLAISSVGPDQKLAPYSSHGKDADGRKGLFLAAPGGNKSDFGEEGGVLQSTVDPQSAPRLDKWHMASYQGTSMATPHAAGVAALVISVLGPKTYDSEQVKTILSASAKEVGDEFEYGSGLLNAGKAVEMAQNQSPSAVPMLVLALAVFLLVAVFVAGKRYFG